MTRTPTEVFRAFGSQPSLRSRKAMARRIAELEAQVQRIASVRSVQVELYGTWERVVFVRDLQRAMEGP